jgi:hypothetical protein
MLPPSDKSNFMATIAWVIVVLFIFSENPTVLTTHSRLLVFFTITAFWYGLSLYMRRQAFKNNDGKIYNESLRYFDKVWLYWYTVLAFTIFLIPATFITILALIYVFTKTVSVELPTIFTTLLWMIFFAFESTYSQGKIFTKFRVTELNLFVVFGVILDIAGLVFSVIEITS